MGGRGLPASLTSSAPAPGGPGRGQGLILARLIPPGSRPPAGQLGAATRWLLVAAAVALLGYLFRKLLVPLLLATFLAYLLHPLVCWAETLAIRRTVAVTALFAVLGAAGLGAWFLLGPRVRAEVAALLQALPTAADQVEEVLAEAARDLGARVPALRRLLGPLAAGGGLLDRLLGRGADPEQLVHQAGFVFITVVLVPVFAFFLLRDGPALVAFVFDRLPPAHIETSVAVWYEIEAIIGRYLRGVALDGLVFGSLTAAGLWALGVPSPLLLGAFAGAANVVPFLGPLLAGVAAGLVALVHTRSLDAVGAVVLLFLAVKVADDAVVQPLVIGRGLHLHPVLFLASVVAGHQALGIVGMVLAVPVATVVQEVARLLIEHRHTLAGHPRDPASRPEAPRVVC